MKILASLMTFLMVTLGSTSMALASNKYISPNGYFNGIRLAGKVKVVEFNPDIKVQVVSSFPDLKVKVVEHFPDNVGEWQFVDYGQDFTIKFVNSFPDIKIKYVSSFPGVN